MATHVTARGVRVITIGNVVFSLAVCEDRQALKLFVLREYFYYCQGTDSTAKTLKMPFIIVHSDLAVASLRLPDTGSHANCA